MHLSLVKLFLTKKCRMSSSINNSPSPPQCSLLGIGTELRLKIFKELALEPRRQVPLAVSLYTHIEPEKGAWGTFRNLALANHQINCEATKAFFDNTKFMLALSKVYDGEGKELDGYRVFADQWDEVGDHRRLKGQLESVIARVRQIVINMAPRYSPWATFDRDDDDAFWLMQLLSSSKSLERVTVYIPPLSHGYATTQEFRAHLKSFEMLRNTQLRVRGLWVWNFGPAGPYYTDYVDPALYAYIDRLKSSASTAETIHFGFEGQHGYSTAQARMVGAQA